MKVLFIALATLCTVSAFAQKALKKNVVADTLVYHFTDGPVVPQTSVKNQASSGTCWSFSGLSFIESELLRQGKGEYDLSDMWVVRNSYFDKAVKYARMHGQTNLSGGGAALDVLNVIDKYGIVPEEAYSGLNYGTTKHQHGELDAAVKAYMDAIIRNPNRELSTGWQAGLNGILDAYLGEVPAKFTYQGAEYTPKSFAEKLGIKGLDYVSITSFTHHPFGEYFAIEVPDNWSWDKSLNLPLDQFMVVIDRSLSAGYPVLWSSDVSEKGFKFNMGFAVLPETKLENLNDSEKAKWSNLTEKELSKALYDIKQPVTEANVTQELRQKWFDNYTTTDDHGMVLVGTATDQNGQPFYKVKNSWAAENPYKGYFYASKPFVKGKTLCVLVHKSMLIK